MLTRIHLTITVLLLAAALTFAGLWYQARSNTQIKVAENSEPSETTSDDSGGRYRIEKVDNVRELIENAGKQGFFGLSVLEAWAFKYSGGYLQVYVETDDNGRTMSGEVLPADWTSLISDDEGIRENKAIAYRKEGYVVLTALPSTVSVTEALANYHFQISGIFSTGNFGPIHALLPSYVPVTHKRPYRLFLSSSPPPKTMGSGFNIWAEYVLPIRGPFIPRRLEDEEFHVGGGKDLAPGKEVTLLDRARGTSRIRLKARFLGDGEVRELATRSGTTTPKQ